MRRLAVVATMVGCQGASLPGGEPLTYHRDVEPLVYTHCVTCHHDGGIGPGDWTNPATVVAWATPIAAAVEDERMPPPVSDPACRPYNGSDRLFMPDAARQRVIDWVAQGAPLGDPVDSPQPGIPDPRLADADTELLIEAPHTLDLDADGNEYFCFVLDNPFTETTSITGFDVALDNREVVHHILLAVDGNGDAGIEFGTDGTTRQFRCQDPIVESDWNILHAWTPGMEPVVFDDGRGMKIEPGDQLVMQMHYFGNPADGPFVDQSGYALRTASSAAREVYMTPFGPTGFRIPAGKKRYRASGSIRNPAPFELQILGAFPHMHLLGSHARGWVEQGDAETCLIDGGYDFNNQLTYMFDEPVAFAPDATAHVECTWNNSAASPGQFFDPPRDITFGEGSNEEMCFLLTYVSP